MCNCILLMLFWHLRVASYDSLQDGTHVALLMPLICTTVQQGHGRQLNSAWRAIAFQAHRSGMWFCSLGDTCKVCCFVFGEVDTSLELLQCFKNCFLCYCLFVMRSTADNYASQTAVDIFNIVTGMWSTAQLSLQRRAMGVTSVGNIALFAGGGVADGTFCTVAEYVVDCVGVDRMCLQ